MDRDAVESDSRGQQDREMPTGSLHLNTQPPFRYLRQLGEVRKAELEEVQGGGPCGRGDVRGGVALYRPSTTASRSAHTLTPPLIAGETCSSLSLRLASHH